MGLAPLSCFIAPDRLADFLEQFWNQEGLLQKSPASLREELANIVGQTVTAYDDHG
jgi:hypothetical protein